MGEKLSCVEKQLDPVSSLFVRFSLLACSPVTLKTPRFPWGRCGPFIALALTWTLAPHEHICDQAGTVIRLVCTLGTGIGHLSHKGENTRKPLPRETSVVVQDQGQRPPREAAQSAVEQGCPCFRAVRPL